MYNELMSKEIRRKRSDAKVGHIEKQYGVDFDVRSDMKLGKFLKETGFSSLTKALKEAEKSKRK